MPKTPVDDPRRNLVVSETNKIKSANLKKIIEYELEKSEGNFKTDFMARHKMTPDVRTRMVR